MEMAQPQQTRAAYSVKDACAQLGGISRFKFNCLLREGRLHARRFGKRIVVTHEEIQRFLRDETEAAR